MICIVSHTNITVIMKSFILRYGLFAGGIILVCGVILWPLFPDPAEAGTIGMAVGFAFMGAAMSFVYFGVREYRASQGGSISFYAALRCGLAIAGIAAVFYVLAWEITYATALSDFAERYGEFLLREFEATSPSKIQLMDKRAEVESFVTSYHLWYVRMPYTLMEISPVGILASLLSAAILRKK